MIIFSKEYLNIFIRKVYQEIFIIYYNIFILIKFTNKEYLVKVYLIKFY